MFEFRGDLWDYHSKGHWVVIPTNGIITISGAIMGAGVARQAADKYFDLPGLLAAKIRIGGNKPYSFSKYHLFSFPTKNNPKNPSSLSLIGESAELLVDLVDKEKTFPPIYLPRVGCGLGRLEWIRVKGVIGGILDDRFVVLDWVKEK